MGRQSTLQHITVLEVEAIVLCTKQSLIGLIVGERIAKFLLKFFFSRDKGWGKSIGKTGSVHRINMW